MTVLTENSYGKSAIRLVRVVRGPERHELRDLTVDIRFSGVYDSAYSDGDNAAVLPTDTMKNTVYALAKQGALGEPEEFAETLVEHFLGGNPEAREVRVHISERLWHRLDALGSPHPHAFTPSAGGRRHATVTARRDGRLVTGGVADLVLLKTTDSGFAGFRKDRYTTLPETTDRILATTVEATWTYQPVADIPFATVWRDANRLLRAGFAEAYSPSVQQTIWAMGNAVLAGCAAIASIHLRLPNIHHLPVNLSPFGLDGRGEVFVATEAPFGVIEGTVGR